MKRSVGSGVGALVGVVMLLSAGCGGSEAQTATNTGAGTATTPATAATASTNTVSDAAGATAALKAAGLPIGEVRQVTAESDGNSLLGRPGQYTSKSQFRDTRLSQEGSDPFSSENGGSVEYFKSAEDAGRRRDYIVSIGKNAPLFLEYDYQNGPALLRLSKRLTPEQAAEYETRLKAIKPK